MDAGPWNWLEVSEIAVGVLTPLAIAVLGIYVHRVTKRFEHAQWRSQKLVEKRLAVYDSIAPDLNDLLCFYTYVGAWKELDPPKVVALKRTIDKKVFLAAPLFSAEFLEACKAFHELCFQTYAGWGRDPLLRTSPRRRRDASGDKWQAEWDACFTTDRASTDEVRAAYSRVMDAFAVDIGVQAVPEEGRPSVDRTAMRKRGGMSDERWTE